jgi:glycosyl-4,4'-diaponeurosporenoate acyltransferase
VIVELPDVVIVGLNVIVWFGWTVGVGWVAHRLPTDRFTRDSWLTRLRAVERDGRIYERRWYIKRWKDRLPEAGAFFAGGFSKRHARRHELERLLIETRRAETVHWVAMLLLPVCAIWNPPAAMVIVVVYALGANLPCVIVQRYNRARLTRIVSADRSGNHATRH